MSIEDPDPPPRHFSAPFTPQTKTNTHKAPRTHT
jgi:hypothetical protein